MFKGLTYGDICAWLSVSDAGIVRNAMDTVFVYLCIQQQSKLKTVFVVGENRLYLRYGITINGQRLARKHFQVRHQE